MMYFKKSLDPAGEYEDANGQRYSIAVARRIRTAEGVNVGYEPFESLAAALATWGLTFNENYAI